MATTQPVAGAIYYEPRASRDDVFILMLSRRNAASDSERTAACDQRTARREALYI